MRRAALPTCLVAACLALACQGGAAPGASCARNADCDPSLVCRLSHCRTECATDRDCPLGASCLFGAESVGACAIPAERSCTGASCPTGLACTSEGCRDVCTDVCRGGNACVAGLCVPSTADAGVVGLVPCASQGECPTPRRCIENDGLTLCALPCTTPADCVGDVDCHALPEVGGGPEVTVCGDPCDPATNAGCPAGAYCAFDVFANGYGSFCRAVAGGAMGEGCPCTDGGDSTECTAGLVCGRESPAVLDRCVRPCRALEICPSGDTCFLPPRAYTLGSETWGYCPSGPAAVCP